MERVQEVARLAQIADFIEGREGGYEEIVGERGIRLSGGQRQRIGIARALYKGASVIVLDEATSALDNSTEKEVMAAIEGLSHQLTVILIAHRLSTLEKCDRIFQLDQGQVCQEGDRHGDSPTNSATGGAESEPAKLMCNSILERENMATTADEVWKLLGELIESQKETERKFQETERFLREQSQETDRKFQETERLLREQSQETDRKFQETERLLREQSQETDRLLREQSQETDRKFQETDRLLREESKRVNNQIGQLGNRLGEFVESQVRPAAVKLFQERGIAVKEIASNTYIQTGKEGLEIDLLVINSSDIILIEAKSKVSEDDVNEHLERLSKFKRFFPRYESYRVLGAVAGMVIPLDVSRYAYRKGLFVIGQSGDNLVILNDDKFRPRGW
nr:ATP-binding cassette domain-containing protein [Cylindrospermopsis raciborskii]